MYKEWFLSPGADGGGGVARFANDWCRGLMAMCKGCLLKSSAIDSFFFSFHPRPRRLSPPRPALCIGLFPSWFAKCADWPPQLKLADFPLFDLVRLYIRGHSQPASQHSGG